MLIKTLFINYYAAKLYGFVLRCDPNKKPIHRILPTKRWLTAGPPSASSTPSVAIVGAGAAGLCAARHLMLNGLTNVIVLEAANRVGGRVFTGNVGQHYVALGAEYIHEQDTTNPLYAAVKRQGQKSWMRNFKTGRFYSSSGHVIDQDLSLISVDLVWKIYQEAMELKATNNWNNNPIESSFEEFLRRRYWEETGNLNADHRQNMERVLNSMINYFAYHLGDSPDLISINELGRFKTMEEGDVVLLNGIQSVLSSIYSTFPEDVVHLRTEITKIKWKNESSKVIIECENKKTFEADHVIFTPSLGYLKRNQNNIFAPHLPDEKQSALLSLGFGRINKVFIGYDVPFWRLGRVGSIRLGWTDKEMHCRNSSDWVKSIFSFDEIYEDERMLVAYVTGPGAEIMENLSDKRIATHCTKLLMQFTGCSYIPEPTQFLRTHWCQHPLFLGAYSYLPVECSNDERVRLADPLPNSHELRLLFAGEATHDRHYGTVHGAMLSGEREADRLLAHYKLPTKIFPY